MPDFHSIPGVKGIPHGTKIVWVHDPNAIVPVDYGTPDPLGNVYLLSDPAILISDAQELEQDPTPLNRYKANLLRDGARRLMARQVNRLPG